MNKPSQIVNSETIHFLADESKKSFPAFGANLERMKTVAMCHQVQMFDAILCKLDELSAKIDALQAEQAAVTTNNTPTITTTISTSDVNQSKPNPKDFYINGKFDRAAYTKALQESKKEE